MTNREAIATLEEKLRTAKEKRLQAISEGHLDTFWILTEVVRTIQEDLKVVCEAAGIKQDEVHFYFDMDGCLAKWGNCTVEEVATPGYFAGRPGERSLIQAVKDMYQEKYHMHILSAVWQDPHSALDKFAWLSLEKMSNIDIIFVPYGSDKCDYIDTRYKSVLVDDFTKNLTAWEAQGHIGVKFYNGINGSNGTWKGISLNNRMSAEEIKSRLVALAA
ncbi:MAG: hypothetical protein J6D07_06005 [Mogibacterium sp.]|nr:hypothetical protein [Mogibacterium sp.]